MSYEDRRSRSSIVTVVALCVLTTLLLATPAAGAPRPCKKGEAPVVNPDTGAVSCTVVRQVPGTPSTPVTPVTGPGNGGGGTWPPPGYTQVRWSVGGSEADGTPCIERHSRWVPDDQVVGYTTIHNLAFFRWYERLPYDILSHLTDCSSQPGEPGLDPQMVRALVTTQLDRPDPAIAPGRAITGLRSYLDIRGPTGFHGRITVTAPALTIDVNASAQYRVDWGDGTIETFASAGGPYPDGDVTHVYTTSGDYTVTVTPVWSVSWAGGGFDVDFTAELASSTVDLPVEEVRAVRTN